MDVKDLLPLAFAAGCFATISWLFVVLFATISCVVAIGWLVPPATVPLQMQLS